MLKLAIKTLLKVQKRSNEYKESVIKICCEFKRHNYVDVVVIQGFQIVCECDQGSNQSYSINAKVESGKQNGRAVPVFLICQ